MIVCLALYSKSASDKWAFHNRLETLFKTALIDSDQIKQKLVERFIVNAVYECSIRMDEIPQEKVQDMMVRLYKDEITSEEIVSHMRYRDDIILENQNEMTKEEISTSQQMKDIQKKHGGGQEEGSGTGTRATSLTEVYGEYLFLIMMIIVVCIMAYMCMSIKGKEKPEQAAQNAINTLKKDRKELILKEKRLLKEIDEVKGKINAAKKSK